MKINFQKISFSFISLFLVCSLLFSFGLVASAGSSTILYGATLETGTGEKSPTNPYRILGTSPDGLPRYISPLHGDGTINDTYDTSTGVLVRQWGIVEIDSSLSYGFYAGANSDEYDTAWFELTSFKGAIDLSFTDIYCSHLPSSSVSLWSKDNVGILLTSDGRIQFRVPKSAATSVATLKTWLDNQKAAGTPVTIVYPLADPVSIEYPLNVSTNYVYQNFGLKDVGAVSASVIEGSVMSASLSESKEDVILEGMARKFSVVLEAEDYFFYLKAGEKYQASVALSVSPYAEGWSGVVVENLWFSTHESVDSTSITPIAGNLIFDDENQNAYLDYTTGTIPESFLCKYIVLDFTMYDTSGNFRFSIDEAVIEQLGLYAPPDDSFLDDLDSLEGQLGNQIQPGVDNAAQYQQSALEVLLTYVNGFQVMAGIVGNIGNIPFLGALLTLSVFIGLFAFLLGMVGEVYRNRSGKSDAQVRREPSTTIFTKWRGGK